MRENQSLLSMSKFHQPKQLSASVVRGSVFVSSGNSPMDERSLMNGVENAHRKACKMLSIFLKLYRVLQGQRVSTGDKSYFIFLAGSSNTPFRI